VHSNKGKIRIIAGEHRGRLIKVAAAPGLRPTPDRVKETLFNWLGQRLNGSACLDLFAGSGALGFEAASRGAARVVMVEKDPRALDLLETNRELLGARQVEIVAGDAFDYLARSRDGFDVVFLDPPFRQNALGPALENLRERVKPGGRVYIESDAPLEIEAHDGAQGPAHWTELRRARAGQVSYQLVEKR
jgi:16S rRNA (guanine966-N2)-methyltransferase